MTSHPLLLEALAVGELSFRTLQRVAGKCMSMTVAIHPASPWTQAMFAALVALETSGMPVIDLFKQSYADIVGEMPQWLGLTATSHEGPWQKARHFSAAITHGTSDASSIA